jgi:hypothetical protein
MPAMQVPERMRRRRFVDDVVLVVLAVTVAVSCTSLTLLLLGYP